MKVETKRIKFKTNGEGDIIDITEKIEEVIKSIDLKNGIVTVFVPGSTGAVTTIEYEPGLLKDLPAMLERIAPKNIYYRHEEMWHDGNGHSHVRAALIGSSLTVPFENKQLLLGTWQQIVFLELDVRKRERELILQIIGD
ncbi:secondary thiamine-phosphate synthase enzyme YjbQ [Candidatus Bathyarchaeota archaeon]|nr:secondary thiamine-phosphate synthase enzyme YjbQ [Candidatus Bathyarchaeota archaeon]